MLLGQYEANLTDKDRLALPKKIRSKLGDEIVLARWYEGCLVVVSSERWSELLLKLTGRAQYVTQPVRDTDRFILGSAFEASLDRQGRFVVPKKLKEYASLSKEVVFLGLGDRVEIWDKKLWVLREALIRKQAEGLIEKIAHEDKKNKREVNS